MPTYYFTDDIVDTVCQVEMAAHRQQRCPLVTLKLYWYSQ